MARTWRNRIAWYGGNSLNPAFWAVCAFRVAHSLWRRRIPLVPSAITCLARVITGAEIDHRADIGPGFVLHHGVGTVIGYGVKIGANCVLHHGVTLGMSNPRANDHRFPTIGADVQIYCHAVVAGPITVGDGATIGANSVVLENVPVGATVMGNPARVILVRPPDWKHS